MEGKNFLHKSRRSQSHRVKGNLAHASFSRRSSAGDRNSNCGNQAAEFACSACVCCFLCPIAVIWCCVKLPCKIGWRAVRKAADRACSCRSGKQVVAEYSSFSDIDSDVRKAADRACSCGSGKQVVAEYSSFSDIDSDGLSSRTNSTIDLNHLIGSKGRIAHRGNACRSNPNRNRL